MPNRNLVWVLVILAVVLVVVPFVGMLGMMAAGGACCPGMMGTTGNMTMSAIGWVWMLTVTAVVIALIWVLVRSVTRA